VFGDGLEGLACAYYLQRGGAAVTVLAGPEPSRELAGRFLHAGSALERFHTAIRPSDGALLGLVHDLGGSHRLVWRHCSSVLRPARRAVRSPRVERAREALTLRWIVRHGRYARGLERLGARSWLCRWAGERGFEQNLEPLLRAQLGEIDDEIPASAAWRALADLTDARERRVGHLRGGLSDLLSALRERLRASGVELAGEATAAAWLAHPDARELPDRGAPPRFDALVATVPVDELPVGASCTPEADLPAARWDTLVSVALVVRSELPLAYRTVCADPSHPAGTCYRADLLVPREDTAGRRVHYFTRRARAGQPLEPREVIEKQARDCLRSLAGGSPVEIEAATVSTARVPAPTRRVRVPGPATPPLAPLFVSRADAHARGEGTDLEAAVLAARITAERVQSHLRQRA
jgi:protoporphyrinogen oxidase